MTRHLHVAAAQVHSGGSIQENLARIERQVVSAAAVGVELILFSEVVLQGYDYGLTPASVRAQAVSAGGAECDRIVGLARRHRMAVLVGLFERDGDLYYNSVIAGMPDGSRLVARKHALTGGEIGAQLTAGPKQRTLVAVNGVRCAVIICADGGIDGLHDDLRAAGADYRLCPTGGGGKISDMLHESDLLTEAGRTRYAENRPRVFNTQAILTEKECPDTGFTSANALGPAGAETCHQGHCMIVDNRRTMRAQIPGTIVLEHMQDQMIHAELTF
jgi:predicted amidohydrolase